MKGGIVIFAAGNDDRNYLSYPACYDQVLSVASVAPDYRKAYYSNYAKWVDVAAPGGTYRKDGLYDDECRSTARCRITNMAICRVLQWRVLMSQA